MIRLVTSVSLDLSRPALDVAPDLIGAVLGHGDVELVVTEVEAYEGGDDPASHAWRGPTPRSRIMFGPSGRVYVYLSHGIHHAMNLVCGPDGTASAVLIRAGRVVAGLDIARDRRPGVADLQLARGPGNLTRALGISAGHDGSVLVQQVADHLDPVATDALRTGPRVGVTRAADRPWRFWRAGDPTISAYRRSPRATSVSPR